MATPTYNFNAVPISVIPQAVTYPIATNTSVPIMAQMPDIPYTPSAFQINNAMLTSEDTQRQLLQTITLYSKQLVDHTRSLESAIRRSTQTIATTFTNVGHGLNITMGRIGQKMETGTLAPFVSPTALGGVDIDMLLRQRRTVLGIFPRGPEIQPLAITPTPRTMGATVAGMSLAEAILGAWGISRPLAYSPEDWHRISEERIAEFRYQFLPRMLGPLSFLTGIENYRQRYYREAERYMRLEGLARVPGWGEMPRRQREELAREQAVHLREMVEREGRRGILGSAVRRRARQQVIRWNAEAITRGLLYPTANPAKMKRQREELFQLAKEWQQTFHLLDDEIFPILQSAVEGVGVSTTQLRELQYKIKDISRITGVPALEVYQMAYPLSQIYLRAGHPRPEIAAETFLREQLVWQNYIRTQGTPEQRDMLMKAIARAGGQQNYMQAQLIGDISLTETPAFQGAAIYARLTGKSLGQSIADIVSGRGGAAFANARPLDVLRALNAQRMPTGKLIATRADLIAFAESAMPVFQRVYGRDITITDVMKTLGFMLGLDAETVERYSMYGESIPSLKDRQTIERQLKTGRQPEWVGTRVSDKILANMYDLVNARKYITDASEQYFKDFPSSGFVKSWLDLFRRYRTSSGVKMGLPQHITPLAYSALKEDIQALTPKGESWQRVLAQMVHERAGSVEEANRILLTLPYGAITKQSKTNKIFLEGEDITDITWGKQKQVQEQEKIEQKEAAEDLATKKYYETSISLLERIANNTEQSFSGGIGVSVSKGVKRMWNNIMEDTQ